MGIWCGPAPRYDPHEDHYRAEALREIEACLRDEPYEYQAFGWAEREMQDAWNAAVRSMFVPSDPRNTPVNVVMG